MRLEQCPKRGAELFGEELRLPAAKLIDVGLRRVKVKGRIAPRRLDDDVARLDKLLAAIDVEGRAGHGRVRHEMDGERGDVGRAHDAADWQRGTQMLATRVQLIAEDRRLERRIDEAGGDQVHAYGRELESKIPRHRGQPGADSR